MINKVVGGFGRDPVNQNFRKFQSKTQWIGSVQPEKFRKNGGGPLFPVGPVGILVEWIAPFISLTWLEVRLTHHTPGVFSILSILPNRPVSPSLDRERFVLFPQSLEALGFAARARALRVLSTCRAGQKPRENGTTLFDWNKVSNRIEAFYFVSIQILITSQLRREIFWNGTASFGRTTGPKGQKGPPLEVDHVGRKISLEPKLSIQFSTEISENFGIMESTPDAVFHPISRQREVCLQGSVLTEPCIKISPQLYFATSGLSHWELKDFYFLSEGS